MPSSACKKKVAVPGDGDVGARGDDLEGHHLVRRLQLDALHSVFFEDPAPNEIYTLSLHDALPISGELGVASKREIRLDSPFERREPQFFESPDRGLRERFERELCERRASPEHERP